MQKEQKSTATTRTPTRQMRFRARVAVLLVVGVFFLANTDVKMRQATGGKYSIDDVVLAIIEKDRAGAVLSNELFLETVKEFSGLDVTADWEVIRTGGHIVPLPGCFDGHFNVEPKEMPEADTGVIVTSYAWTLKEDN